MRNPVLIVLFALHCMATNPPKWIVTPSDVTGGTSQISKAGVVSPLTTYQVLHAYDNMLHEYVSYTTAGLVSGDIIIQRPTSVPGVYYTSDIIRFGVSTVNTNAPDGAFFDGHKLAPLSLIAQEHSDINTYYVNAVWDADYVMQDFDNAASVSDEEVYSSELKNGHGYATVATSSPSLPMAMPHILPRILSIAMPSLGDQTPNYQPAVTITGVFGFFWFSIRPGSLAFSTSLPTTTTNVIVSGSAVTGSYTYSPSGSMPGSIPGVAVTYDFGPALQNPCSINNGGCASTATCSNAALNCVSAATCVQVCTCPTGCLPGPFAGGVLGGVCASYLRTCVAGAPNGSPLACSPTGALHCQSGKCYINKCEQNVDNCSATQTCIPNFDLWICSG